ncbi:MAG: type III-A CRISPR-associated protein Csm2 [Gammaproteobacteria bacterium]|nr:MAG: type III-A CRISPR-associated protein Csm2 [Gammaproteobacteria bacterium]
MHQQQLDKIKFTGTIDAELFSSTAKETAQKIGENKNNKPTQLRRFYDEIVMWHEKTQQADVDKFKEYLPFIKMINAKVAYAKGRKHVDDNYMQLINHCLKQVTDQKTMNIFKTFMEAFMGFYKVYGPKS